MSSAEKLIIGICILVFTFLLVFRSAADTSHKRLLMEQCRNAGELEYKCEFYLKGVK